MSTSLIIFATSRSNSYPIVFMRLGVPCTRSNAHFKLRKCQESNPRPRDQ